MVHAGRNSEASSPERYSTSDPTGFCTGGSLNFIPRGSLEVGNMQREALMPRGSMCFHKMRASAPTFRARITSRQSGFQQGRSSRNEKPFHCHEIIVFAAWLPHACL